MRFLVAIAALLTAALSTPATPQEAVNRADFPHDEAAIVLIRCARPDGVASGTAFKIGPTYYVTAHHVVDGATMCVVGGQIISIDTMDVKHDIATFTGPASPAIIKPYCGNFKHGQTYMARGYPGGGNYNIWAPQIAMNLVLGGYRVMVGDVYHGMSGGPVIDTEGRAVGIVNMLGPSRSMPLSSTGVCK